MDNIFTINTASVDSTPSTIDVFDVEKVAELLRYSGKLTYICIDASCLKQIEIEYGKSIYLKIYDLLVKYLEDINNIHPILKSSFKGLYKKSQNENIYYLLLDKTLSVELTQLSAIEKFCDELTLDIHNYLRTTISTIRKDIIEELGYSIKDLPYPSVASYESIYNPCLDTKELVEHAIRASLKNTIIQKQRFYNTKKEFINALLINDHLLYPNFQAVINLQQTSDSLIEDLEQNPYASLVPLIDNIFGFEALIRLDTEKVSQTFDITRCLVHPKFLNPDLLFYLAKEVHRSLELDQLCIKRIYEFGANLPGYLMINILPRNLYKIDELNQYLTKQLNIINNISNDKLIFEISESEVINNLSLITETIGRLQDLNIKIATDDFGNGFTRFEQLIEMKPNIIKLDRSLITDIDHSSLKQAYIEGIMKAAIPGNIMVLAEGIETAKEALTLKQMGIKLGQGFLFHKPESLEDINQELQKASSEEAIAS